MRFGRLQVITEVEPPATQKYAARRWLCRCDCGNEKVFFMGSLTSGMTTSCGCLRNERARENIKKAILAAPYAPNTKHGLCHTPEWRIWSMMRARCSPNAVDFHLYAGRGIYVCERWNSFANFLDDMKTRPSPKHSIDRIDNNGPYSPENCRWATSAEQARNKRTNVFYTHDAITLCLTDWSKLTGIKRETLKERLRRGWSIIDALSTKVQDI